MLVRQNYILLAKRGVRKQASSIFHPKIFFSSNGFSSSAAAKTLQPLLKCQYREKKLFACHLTLKLIEKKQGTLNVGMFTSGTIYTNQLRNLKHFKKEKNIVKPYKQNFLSTIKYLEVIQWKSLIMISNYVIIWLM